MAIKIIPNKIIGSYQTLIAHYEPITKVILKKLYIDLKRVYSF